MGGCSRGFLQSSKFAVKGSSETILSNSFEWPGRFRVTSNASPNEPTIAGVRSFSPIKMNDSGTTIPTRSSPGSKDIDNAGLILVFSLTRIPIN